MTNPSHYPSLENCKKLTEAGFPNKKTEKVFIQKDMFSEEYNLRERGDYSQYESECYSILVCPSVSELLDELPTFIEDVFVLKITFLGETSIVQYLDKPEEDGIYTLEDKTPDALARMWIWLKENGYL